MSIFGEVPPLRLRLSALLRRYRLRAGLSGEEMASLAAWSQSKVSRLELAQSAPSIPDIERWAEVTGVSIEEKADLVSLANAASAETVSWRKARKRGLVRVQEAIGKLEISATLKREFQPVLIPGLLQTASYSMRIFRAGHKDRPDLAAAVAARIARQKILKDKSHFFEFIVLESVLRARHGSPEEMSEQLDHLVEVIKLPNVAIGVVSQDTDLSVWHQHGFSLFENRGEELPLAHVETLTAGLNISAVEEVERYREAFRQLREVASWGKEAKELISAISF